MRTTLTIDDDVLNAAKALAAHQGRSVGEVVSAWARQSIIQEGGETPAFRNGIRLLPARPGAVVTTEHINALRDELP